MASPTDTKFGFYAGQEVAGGSSTTPYNQPIIDFGDPFNKTALANLASINGLLPKVGRSIIHDTKVYEAPLLKIFKRMEDPYGVATEHAVFSDGAANKLNDGTCVPRGSVAMTPQLTASNLAWNVPINIYDREVNGALLSDAEIGNYVAQKMRTMDKTIRRLQFEAAKVMISDCVPGKRTISSKSSSDDTGSSVTLTSTPEGYAGKVFLKSEWTVPEVVRGSVPALANTESGKTVADLTVGVLDKIRNFANDMIYPATDYNALGVDTYTEGKPWCIMESQVLDAMEASMRDSENGYGPSGFPTQSIRGFINQYCDLVEIDAFAALPAYDSATYPDSVDYTGKRMICSVMDKEAPWLITKWANMEGQRCAGERMYGYSARGEQDMAIWKGANSAVIIVDA